MAKHRGLTISEDCYQELAELTRVTGITSNSSAVAYSVKRVLREEKNRIARDSGGDQS